MTPEQEALLRQILAEVRALKSAKAEPKQLLSARQAAKALGIGRDLVATLIATKRVKVMRVDGRARIPRAEIERLTLQGINTEESFK